MAVSKIDVVSIIGSMEELERVTAVCGNSSIFHPDNTLSFYSDTSDFSPINDENPYSTSLQSLTDAVTSAGLPLELQNPKDIAEHTYSDAHLQSYVAQFVETLNRLQQDIKKTEQAIGSRQQSIQNISHFIGLNLDLREILGCKYIKVRFGNLPKESFEKLSSYRQNPYIVFFPCTQEGSRYWGVYFAPMKELAEVDRIFSSLYFERLWLTDISVSPEGDVQKLELLLQEDKIHLDEARQKLTEFWDAGQAECQVIYTALTEKSVYFGIRRYAARYGEQFCLTGWVPTDQRTAFSKQLDQLKTVSYSFDAATDVLEHSPPVQLKNKRLFKPFEMFVDMYGLPSYDEPDPTPFVALTYTLLFGIMFGDLGQGLVLAVLSALAWRFKGWRLARLLVPCGISSAFFGLVYGSVFGFEHLLDPFYKKLGFASKPVEVMEPATTNVIIYAAVGIGFVLVAIAMILNIISSLRRRNYENALFSPNGLAGLVFYVSLVGGLVCQLFLGVPIMTTPYVLCLIALPLLCIFLKEVLGDLIARKPGAFKRSWGEYLMQNFFELFECLLSYATNTISFMRVGAFVLVHAGMMLVVFTLAEMSSGITYWIIVAVGNVVIMGLEGLLVGIQVLRLEFYEMFSRFFDGGGRPFQPVTIRKEQ